jgi:hypothetical protein
MAVEVDLHSFIIRNYIETSGKLRQLCPQRKGTHEIGG